MIDRRGRVRTRVAALLLAGGIGVGFGACSQAQSSTPPSSAPSATSGAPSASPASESTIPTPAGSTMIGAPCTRADVKASHGIVEGAAGSRLTTVVLVASTPCAIDAFPAMGLRDVAGTALVGASAGGSGRLELVAGGVYESDVRLANWCAPEPKFPLRLELEINGEDVAVTGDSFPEDGDMPPCNGGGGPVLEAGAWAEAP